MPRRGLQAYALGLAYEFDPYFGLSISRVDPLPHQLVAVYDVLLKLARVPFLLADDASAGKTVMAGLLIRELELRGLAERTGGARAFYLCRTKEAMVHFPDRQAGWRRQGQSRRRGSGRSG